MTVLERMRASMAKASESGLYEGSRRDAELYALVVIAEALTRIAEGADGGGLRDLERRVRGLERANDP